MNVVSLVRKVTSSQGWSWVRVNALGLLIIAQICAVVVTLPAQGVKVHFPKYLGNTCNVLEKPDKTLLAATNKKDSATQAKWDIVVTNFNADFSTRWVKAYSAVSSVLDQGVVDFAIDSSDNTYLLKWNADEKSRYNSVMKINKTGEVQWDIAISTKDENAKAFAERIKYSAFDNTVVIAGASPYGGKPILTKVKADGKIQFVSGLDLNVYSTFKDLEVYEDGSVIATGLHNVNWLYIYQLLVVKFDAGGAQKWQKYYYYSDQNGGIQAYGNSICKTDDGNAMIVGYVTENNSQSSYLRLMKINQSGDSIFTTKYLEPSWNFDKIVGYKIVNLPDNKLLIHSHQNDGFTSVTPTLLKIYEDGSLYWKQVGFRHPTQVNLRSVMSTGHLLLSGASRNDDLGWAAQAPIIFKTTSAGLYERIQPFTPYDTIKSFPHTMIMKPYGQIYRTIQLQIATDANFANIIGDYSDSKLFETDPGGQIKFVLKSLPMDKFYFWRARSIDFEDHYTEWGDALRFGVGKPVSTYDLSAGESPVNLSCYPNPTTGPIQIEFNIDTEQEVTLDLYDYQGKHIRAILQNEKMIAGHHQLMLQQRDLPPNLYLLQLRTQKGVAVEKLRISQ